MRTIELLKYFFSCKEDLYAGRTSMEDFASISLTLAQDFIKDSEYGSVEEQLADHFYDFASLVKEEIFLYWYKQGQDHLKQKPKVPDDFDRQLRKIFAKDVEKLAKFVEAISEDLISTSR